MTTAEVHYESHLARSYPWMAGGMDAAMRRGRNEVERNCPAPRPGQVAVDLGSGFGMHAIPLARKGYRVLAVDTSSWLLGLLRDHSEALPIHAVEDSILHFPRHLEGRADLIVCMGDALTHLPDCTEVERLFVAMSQSLRVGGQALLSFRDYTTPLKEAQRFIPVMSSAQRILTCFLEFSPETVCVHDILHEREDSGWQLRVSTHRKLRLSPAWVCRALQAQGLCVYVEAGRDGMTRVFAKKY
ncbi:MAG TPA: class I SAM-dependent methyltransferase [Holophagaceae bacterium]|nr:class I SAM-dependent methyltransferase [Holophagaceae bacterium]